MADGTSKPVVLPLSRQHDRIDFSCGNATLDRYLKEFALQDARRRIAAPFVAVFESAPDKICGYYTLSAYAVRLGELPDSLAKRLPSYPRLPATLLGRLAVDLRHQGQSLGEFLLIDALNRAFEQSARIGAAAVVVDAIDDNAVAFYRHFGFPSLADAPRRLFLPMRDVAVLFK
jgi:GNAT superfamily N-acetyltransferase